MAGYNYYGQNYGNSYVPTYYPTNYQPIVQPQLMQSQSPQVTVPTQSSPTQVSNVWVNSKEEADQFIVAPNNAVRLWSTKEPVFYLKVADATGKPTLTTYDVVERQESVSAKDVEQPDYVTKNDFGKVSNVLNGIVDEISSLKSEIDTIKGDMYGIAGKKKSPRKAEVVEDE